MTDWDDIRHRYGDVVWTTCYRILAFEADALDCYQDVFVEAMSRPDTSEAVHNWGGWLRWLATRRALDALRKRRRDAVESTLTERTDATAGPEDVAMMDETIALIRDELQKLPADQATAFWLGSVEQVPYAEVGAQMEITSGHVGVLVHRARKTIKSRLKEYDPTAPT